MLQDIVRVLGFYAFLHGDVTITFFGNLSLKEEGDGGSEGFAHYFFPFYAGFVCVSLVCWLISFLWIRCEEDLCVKNARR